MVRRYCTAARLPGVSGVASLYRDRFPSFVDVFMHAVPASTGFDEFERLNNELVMMIIF